MEPPPRSNGPWLHDIEDPGARPIRNALHTTHRHLVQAFGLALKYPADVAPFGCLAENTTAALRDLRMLMAAGETAYILGDPPPVGGELLYRGITPCLQMVFPSRSTPPNSDDSLSIAPLTCADAPAMVALTDVAFPGFFRQRTCVMGRYFGIWDPGSRDRLVAMAGERLVFHPHREISGVCTHPDFRGRGLAAALTSHVLRHQQTLGANSFLHVVTTNDAAIHVYRRLGFETLREVHFHRLKHPE